VFSGWIACPYPFHDPPDQSFIYNVSLPFLPPGNFPICGWRSHEFSPSPSPFVLPPFLHPPTPRSFVFTVRDILHTLFDFSTSTLIKPLGQFWPQSPFPPAASVCVPGRRFVCCDPCLPFLLAGRIFPSAQPPPKSQKTIPGPWYVPVADSPF